MRRSWAGALATSCIMHLGLVGAGAWLLSRALSGQEHAVEVVRVVEAPSRDLELPTVKSLGEDADLPAGSAALGRPEQTPPRPGGERVSRPDLAHPGRGGSARASLQALNLADRVTQIAVDRELRTEIEQSQLQRLRTARRRQSLDDRRATPNPMQLTFVVTGAGERLERRPSGPTDPARGHLAGATPSRAGRTPGNPALPGEGELMPGGEPGSRERHAVGVHEGTGVPSLRARVITARPVVRQARAAVPANTRARASDTEDSSQKVASLVRSLVHAGGIGGPRGEGRGGEPAPGNPGRDGARGPGAVAAPSGEGPGVGASMGSDTGLSRYYTSLLAQVNWDDAFPVWAIARGMGGLTVLGLTLDEAGHVRDVSIVRPSGIAEFDENLIAAIRRDGPYGRLPPAAGGRLRLQIAFDAMNPVVGRDGGGPGGRGR